MTVIRFQVKISFETQIDVPADGYTTASDRVIREALRQYPEHDIEIISSEFAEDGQSEVTQVLAPSK